MVLLSTKTSTELEQKNFYGSAYFLPSSIRKTTSELTLNTDAKYRFERGIDPNSVNEGLQIATELILKDMWGSSYKFLIAGKIFKKTKLLNLITILSILLEYQYLLMRRKKFLSL